MLVTSVRRPLSPLFRRMTAIVLAMLICLPTLSGATDFAERRFGDYREWRVYWSAPLRGCYAEKRLPDGGHIRFGKQIETGSLVIDFQAASVDFPKPGESYDMVLEFDRHPLGIIMSGSDSDSHQRLHGVYPQAEPLVQLLKQSDNLGIYHQKKRLNLIFLRGSSAALGAVESCLAEMTAPPGMPADIGPVRE